MNFKKGALICIDFQNIDWFDAKLTKSILLILTPNFKKDTMKCFSNDKGINMWNEKFLYWKIL